MTDVVFIFSLIHFSVLTAKCQTNLVFKQVKQLIGYFVQPTLFSLRVLNVKRNVS